MCKKSKTGNSLTLSMGRQVFSHPQESSTPSPLRVTWEDKQHHPELCCLLSSSPIFCMPIMMPYGLGFPFGQLGPAALAVSPPSLDTPSLLSGGGSGLKSKKGFTQQ